MDGKGQRENLFLSSSLGMLSICGFPDCGKQVRTDVFCSFDMRVCCVISGEDWSCRLLCA